MMSSPSTSTDETTDAVVVAVAVAVIEPPPPATPPQQKQQQQQHRTSEPAASRIPKPSPLPLRRALSQRLRSGSDGALTQLDYGSEYGSSSGAHHKPYNCSVCVAEETTHDSGSTSLTSNSPPCPNCRTHYIDIEPDALDAITTAPSPPTSGTASQSQRRHHQQASTSTATAARQQQQRRVSCTDQIAMPNSRSLSSIGGKAMAHTQNGDAGAGGAHQKEAPAHANGKLGRAHSLHHGMSLDLNQINSSSHTHQQHHHHHHSKQAPHGATTHTSSRSTNPSPLAQRRSASAHRANSYPNGSATSCIQSPVTPRTPHGGGGPLLPRRLSPKTPPVSPDEPLTGYAPDDDIGSVYSYTSLASGRTTMSCDHPFVARNGTTFSGRQMKYVVHCSTHAGQTGDDYLTPTQRATKHIRRLKMLLSQAHIDLEQRDSEILRLTKEVVELRLFKASLSSPEADRSNSSDAVTVREMGDPATSTDVSPIVIDGEIGADAGDQVDGRRRRSSGSTGADGGDDDDEDAAAIMCKSVSPRHYAPTALFLDKVSAHSEMQSSFADSGHFDDITCTSSVHSRDSYVQTMPQTATASATAGTSSSDGAAGVAPLNGSTGSLLADGSTTMSAAAASAAAFERSELIRFYELKIEDLIKNHSDESQEVRVTHNDRVEALLRRLAECNARYADAVPDHEQAKERIRELERQLEELQQRLQDQENTQNKTYLHMFAKGQEAERLQQADKVMELASASVVGIGAAAGGARVSVPELMQQLQVTQNELENIKDSNYVQERGNAQVLLSAKEAISLWLLGARKTMYRRLIDAQQSKSRVDPEVTLQFLKSAVYYFLTDKENNTRGHLNAIESILGFSDAERRRIEQARGGPTK